MELIIRGTVGQEGVVKIVGRHFTTTWDGPVETLPRKITDAVIGPRITIADPIALEKCRGKKLGGDKVELGVPVELAIGYRHVISSTEVLFSRPNVASVWQFTITHPQRRGLPAKVASMLRYCDFTKTSLRDNRS